MKILHCIANMVGGGAERQCTLLAKAQVQRGDDVHVALISGGPNLPFLEQSGAKVHWVRSWNYHDPRILSQLVRLMRELAPDIVQTWLLQMDVAAGLATQMAGVPWVLTERSSGAMYWGTIKGWLRRRVGWRAATIVANSASGAGYWRREVGERTPIEVVPNVVPFEAIAASAVPVSGANHGQPLVLFAGRFIDQKNLSILLEALELVLAKTQARAMLCGTGPMEGVLRRRIRALGLGDRVKITEYRHDLWSLMKSAKVFVSISHFEGHPNTVLEAMACRCPLVVSDIAEHREFLDETAAWLVDRWSPLAVARAIAEALTDGTTAARKTDEAWKRVRQYSDGACAERYARIYEKVRRPATVSA